MKLEAVTIQLLVTGWAGTQCHNQRVRRARIVQLISWIRTSTGCPSIGRWFISNLKDIIADTKISSYVNNLSCYVVSTVIITTTLRISQVASTLRVVMFNEVRSGSRLVIAPRHPLFFLPTSTFGLARSDREAIRQLLL